MKRNLSPAGQRWRKYRMKSRLFLTPFPLIPLLNIFLLIFIFALSNSAFVLKPGINVRLPAGGFEDGAFYNSMVVIATQEGLVFFNDERVLMDSLGNKLQAVFNKNKSLQLTVEADVRAPYDTIIRILNMATATGISNIYLSVRPTFGEELMP